LRIRSREEGAAAVEFAIVASLLFMILFGIIEFGIVFNRFQGLQAGAREGARLGSIQTATVGQIMDRTRAAVSMIDTSSANEVCPIDNTAGHYCITITTTNTTWSQTSTQTAGCTSASGTTACQTVPCQTTSGSGTGQITVQVQYKMKITIPLWASPLATVSGAGQFNCE